jgi:integrase
MIDPKVGRITLAAWIEEWQAERTDLAPSTLWIYDHNLRAHILPALGSMPLSSIRRVDVERWVKRLQRTTDLNPATIHQAFRVLRSVLTEAVMSGRLSTNPAAGRKLAPKLKKVKVEALAPERVATLANEITPRYRALVLVAAYCGRRRGELAGLRWANANLLTRRIQVVEQLDRSRVVGPPKTEASDRKVPIPPFLVAELEAHRDAGYSSDDYVFTTVTGLPLEVGWFRTEHWLPACQRAERDGKLSVGSNPTLSASKKPQVRHSPRAARPGVLSFHPLVPGSGPS